MTVVGPSAEAYRAIRQMLDNAERYLAARLTEPEDWEQLEVARTEVARLMASLPRPNASPDERITEYDQIPYVASTNDPI